MKTPTLKLALRLESRARALWSKRTLANSWQATVAETLWAKAQALRQSVTLNRQH